MPENDAIDLVNSYEVLARQYAQREDNYGITMVLLYGFAMLARVIIFTFEKVIDRQREYEQQLMDREEE